MGNDDLYLYDESAIDLFIKTLQMLLPSEVNRAQKAVYIPNGKE